MIKLFKRDDISSQKRIMELEKRVTLIENDILNIVVTQEQLRTKLLKRLQGKKKEEEETQDIYNGILLKE